MSFAFNGVSSQITRITDCHVFRGRERLTVGFWFRRSLSISGSVSFWRQDLVFTPLQMISSSYRWVYWNSSNSLSATTASYGLTAGPWQFGMISYSRNGGHAYRYVPGTAPVLTTPSLTVTTNVTSTPGTNKPMVLGGTETSTEIAPAGAFLGELMVLRTIIAPSAIMQLAFEPQRFAKDMLFYAPLRYAAPRTKEVNGRSYAFQYGTTARDQIIQSDHPPVERWTNTIFPSYGIPTYASASLNVRVRRTT